RPSPLPDAHGYAELLPKSTRPDRREGFLDLWKGKLGPWEDLNAFQRELVLTCRKIIDERGVALVYAVTNSGKTTVARVGMTMALNGNQTAMMLLPTKALVAQEEAEWRSWYADDERLQNLRVYGVSRDYPESDRPVGRGNYDVAVAIYEKLGVYLVNGMGPLGRSGLLVVDELQMLAESSERAAKLEALLTLIKMLPPEQRPALLGLSAALTPEAGAILKKWLGTGRTIYTPSTNDRPVPLDSYVVDRRTWLLQRDAHLLSMPGEQQPEAPIREQHALPALRTSYPQAMSGLNKLQGQLSTAELAASLVVGILKENGSRRIICFVPTRTAADQLAMAIQKVLDAALNRPQAGSPWRNGRFKSESSAARDDEGNLYWRLRNSDIPEHKEVTRGLRTGVASHSAALAPPLRRLLEEEFRSDDGLLRVLVATDTLAVGLNLPADTVIATSITGVTGSGSERSRQILQPSDLDNKGGRAGRRGKTTTRRGKFYILVPSERELQRIDGLTNDEIKELASVDGVYRRFVASKSRSLTVTSQFRDPVAISGLVLQVLCQDGRRRDRDSWFRRVREILDNLLISFEPGAQLPAPERVLEELEDRQLVTTVISQGGPRKASEELALTGLGQAVGRSGLELDDAPDLERLAALARSDAGTIDLLWHAFRARSIRQVTAWVALPTGSSSRHQPSLRGTVLTMAMAHCAEDGTRRTDCAQFVAFQGKEPLPERLLRTPSKVVSRELRELLDSDEEYASTDEVNALLRAVVAYEWLHGVPFSEMQRRFSRVIKSHEDPDRGYDKSPSLKLFYSDVEQLCEQVAGYIRAAADISVTADGVDHSGRMQLIAQRVEAGLPSWLALVAKMRIPALHRERLAKLADKEPPSVLSDLVDMEPLREGLTDAEREEARRIIDNRVSQEQQQRERIAWELGQQLVPNGDGETFDDISAELEAATGALDYLEKLCWTARCLGAETTRPESQGDYAVAHWTCEGADERVTVRVPLSPLTGTMAREIANHRCLVVVRDRRMGVQEALEAQGSLARFLEPDHMLSVLARLVKTLVQVSGTDVITELSNIRSSSMGASDWSLPLSQAVFAPPAPEG
ncbi:DEAD/DEAH box helicase, partial [Streptomyces sp. TRM64462]|uniref:DEAD/DEAH box helicase n=1 Tax=Streptomyces sp. TRM64462 TaxID=2741726 RepID=UPI0015863481